MKLEFVKDINEYNEDAMRLYDFSTSEVELFRLAVQDTVLKNKKPLDLSTLEFIESLNCRLILHPADEDTGIFTDDGQLFFCDLTQDGYKTVLSLTEPYSKKNLRSFQSLYDLDTEIDFIFDSSTESALEF